MVMKNKFIGNGVAHDIVEDDIKFIIKNLRVGSEKETANIDQYQKDNLCIDLQVSNTYDYISDNGVMSVVSDGSISPRGYEIIEAGSNESFNTRMARDRAIEKIIRKYCKNEGCNNSTGSHISLMLAQNRNMPAIYVSNFWQICRKNLDALYWMTGTNPSGIMRNGLSRYAKAKITISPINNSSYMCELSKYSAVNLSKMQYSNNYQTIKRLFIEVRFPDRTHISELNVCSKILFQAILLKAIRLSKHGLITVDDNMQAWTDTKIMVDKLENHNILSDDEKQRLKDKAIMLIDWLLPEIKSFDGESIGIMRKIALNPIHELYKAGLNDNQIIKRYGYKNPKKHNKSMVALTKIIELNEIQADNSAAWKKIAADKLNVSCRAIELMLKKYNRTAQYDEHIKSYILI